MLRMNRAAIYLLPAALLLVLSDSAHADGYVGVGVGSDSQLHGDIAEHFTTGEEATSSRIHIGERFGAIALEASLFGSQLVGMADARDYSTISLGVDLKYYVGLVGSLEGYGKVGLNKTWLDSPAATDEDYEGRGQALGLGLQYSFNLAMAEVGLWADYTVQKTELRDDQRMPLDGQLAMLNLGLSLGF